MKGQKVLRGCLEVHRENDDLAVLVSEQAHLGDLLKVAPVGDGGPAGVLSSLNKFLQHSFEACRLYLNSDFRVITIRVLTTSEDYIWVVVKIMVPFWTPIIIRHLIFRVPKKGPSF